MGFINQKTAYVGGFIIYHKIYLKNLGIEKHSKKE